MSVSIGSVTFDDDLEQLNWVDKNQSQYIGQSYVFSLVGSVHFYEHSKRGRVITLEAERDYCWLQDATVASLITLAQTVGAIYTFDWNGELYTVKFDSSNDSAIDVVRIELPLSYWVGTIHLIEV